MDFFRKIKAEWWLRLGLGSMYIYSGISFFRNPDYWVGFIPEWFSRIVVMVMPIELYLRVQGAGELFLAFLLLAWFLPRWAVRLGAALTALELASILIFVGVDPVTFRDIGLLAGALALLVITTSE